MFRTQEKMAENSEIATNQVEFISRISSLPSVNLAVNYAIDSYAKTKESNAIFNYTLGTAEKSISAVVKTAEPIVNKFQAPVKYVDDIACKGLDKLEEKMPFIKQTPEQMINNTKSYYQSKIDEGFNKYNDAKNSGTEKIVSATNAILDTKYGKFVADNIDSYLTVTDNYVDYLLPAVDETENNEKDPKNSVEKAANISQKVYYRLTKRAHQNVDFVQTRARNTLTQLNVAFTLIDQVKKNVAASNGKLNQSFEQIQSQIHGLYNELMKEDTESYSDKKNLNDKLFYITRQLSQKLALSLTSAVESSKHLPTLVNERIHQSQVYASEMCSQLIKTTKIEEINTQVYETFKPKIQYIQSALLDLAKYPIMNKALQYLIRDQNTTIDSTSSEADTESEEDFESEGSEGSEVSEQNTSIEDQSIDDSEADVTQ